MNSFLDRLIIDKSIADELEFNPYYPLINSGLADEVQIDDENFIDLASNDYLGLSSHPEVKNAIIEGVKKFGASGCGTPIATGYSTIFQQTEQRISSFLNLDDSIIFPSCYQANLSLFSAIVHPNDVIIFDHYVHASMIHGIKSAGCKIKPFKHNDMNHLEKVLKRSQDFEQIFVVTESVFSTEGAIAPFAEIVELCKKFDATPVVDDSHGIGAIGENGRGILEYVKNFNGIYTASLGKAIANAGGVIAGDANLIDFLRYSCSGLIYSTALPSSIFFGIAKVLDIIEREFAQRSHKMWLSKRRIEEALHKTGFKLADGKAPIISIVCKNPLETIKLSKILYENHILCTPFIPPSVPPDSGVVRLIAGANLKTEQVDRIIDVIGKI